MNSNIDQGMLSSFFVMTISARERGMHFFTAQTSNNMRVVPIAGTISDHSLTRNEVMGLNNGDQRTGEQIEKNWDMYLPENLPKYTRMNCSDAMPVQLSNGTLLPCLM